MTLGTLKILLAGGFGVTLLFVPRKLAVYAGGDVFAWPLHFVLDLIMDYWPGAVQYDPVGPWWGWLLGFVAVFFWSAAVVLAITKVARLAWHRVRRSL